MCKRHFSIARVLAITVLLVLGCSKKNEMPTSPVSEGRRGQWLNDGIVGVRAIDFYESFGGAVGGPFGFGGDGVSLGMTYEVINLSQSPLSFDKVGVEFKTSTIGEENDFFPSTNTITVISDEGYSVYFGGPFGDKPDLPETKLEPFFIPPSRVLQLEVDGHGTPLQLVVDGGDARRDYKIIITFYSGDTPSHGPFTINVTAREKKGDKQELIFQ